MASKLYTKPLENQTGRAVETPLGSGTVMFARVTQVTLNMWLWPALDEFYRGDQCAKICTCSGRRAVLR